MPHVELDPNHQILEPERLLSPSLLIFRPLVRGNLEQMIAMAHGVERLRTHVKTHKMPALIRLQVLEFGICKFKCATIAEAEMICQVSRALDRPLDVLLAYPLVLKQAKANTIMMHALRTM